MCSVSREEHQDQARIASHGQAVQLHLNLEVHDLLPVSHDGGHKVWHSGDVIFDCAYLGVH